MSYLTQMLGAHGAELRVGGDGHGRAGRADSRLHARDGTGDLGSFWVDLTRSTLYVLLPLSLVLALVLVSQGVVQTFEDRRRRAARRHGAAAAERRRDSRVLALGPAASQIAIKQLGTNGGGFFNVNSAHPFENPTPLSNFLELSRSC
jgi:K+-transporting ATPase ATPase A chain